MSDETANFVRQEREEYYHNDRVKNIFKPDFALYNHSAIEHNFSSVMDFDRHRVQPVDSPVICHGLI